MLTNIFKVQAKGQQENNYHKPRSLAVDQKLFASHIISNLEKTRIYDSLQ